MTYSSIDSNNQYYCPNTSLCAINGHCRQSTVLAVVVIFSRKCSSYLFQECRRNLCIKQHTSSSGMQHTLLYQATGNSHECSKHLCIKQSSPGNKEKHMYQETVIMSRNPAENCGPINSHSHQESGRKMCIRSHLSSPGIE